MGRRGIIAGVAAVVLALVAILVLSGPSTDPYDRPPLDPRGTGPEGTAAAVELFRAEGARVRIGGLPRDADDVVLQLRDTLSGDAADDLEEWVRDGGTLVLADPVAPLGPPLVDELAEVVDEPSGCELTALAEVEVLDPGLPAELATGPDSSSCFVGGLPGDEAGAGVDVRRLGTGLVVTVSTPLLLTNERLGEADNAVLAVSLVAAWDDPQIRVLDPERFYSDSDDIGDGTVLGALPPRGSQAISQLVVAFLVWALVSGRRLGRPVVEELPVPLPASDLVLASGRLLDRNGDVGDAAERLRRRARRDLGGALGLGPDPHPTELAAALRSRPGIDPSLVERALLTPIVNEAGLVATATHLDRLRRDLHR